MTLSLNDDQVEVVLYALRDLVARRRLAGRPVPVQALTLYRTLELASACGSESDSEGEELDSELIDSGAAAEILQCSTRWIRTIRTDLDGRKVGGHWVFQRKTVIEYAHAKGIGGDSNRIPPTGGRAVPA